MIGLARVGGPAALSAILAVLPGEPKADDDALLRGLLSELSSGSAIHDPVLADWLEYNLPSILERLGPSVPEPELRRILALGPAEGQSQNAGPLTFGKARALAQAELDRRGLTGT